MQKINFQDLPSTSTPLNATNLNQLQTNIENAINNIPISEGIPVGTIHTYAGSTAPTGYMICNGSAVSRTTYSDLFAVIGTTYGNGNGSTTFNIPNLKGRVVVGLDNNDTDFDTLGETGGSKELQSHYHDKITISGGSQVLYSGESIDNVSQQLGVKNNSGSANQSYKEMLRTSNAGTGNSGNLQPYIVLNYIIKY